VRRFIVTVKMQGPQPDWDTLDRFAAVPGSQLVHLHHNKHELTWLL
jgi:23S rRNA (cytidine2498-2'-O)-methyltransferase